MSTGIPEAVYETEDPQQLEASWQVDAMKALDAEAVREVVLAGLRGDGGEDLLDYIRCCIALGDAPLWMRGPEAERNSRALARLVNAAMGQMVTQRWAGGLPR